MQTSVQSTCSHFFLHSEATCHNLLKMFIYCFYLRFAHFWQYFKISYAHVSWLLSKSRARCVNTLCNATSACMEKRCARFALTTNKSRLYIGRILFTARAIWASAYKLEKIYTPRVSISFLLNFQRVDPLSFISFGNILSFIFSSLYTICFYKLNFLL